MIGQLKIDPPALAGSKRLLLICTLAQFLACTLIYMISCEISILAYFQNCIYACALFGLGLGCLTSGADRAKVDQTRWFTFFTIICLFLMIAHFTEIGSLALLKGSSTYFVLQHFLSDAIKNELLMTAVVLTIFLLTVRAFVSLGHLLGKQAATAGGAAVAASCCLGGACLGWLLHATALQFCLPPAISVAVVIAAFVVLNGFSLGQAALALLSIGAVLSFDTVLEPRPIMATFSRSPSLVRNLWTPFDQAHTYPYISDRGVLGFAVIENQHFGEPCLTLDLTEETAKKLSAVYGEYCLYLKSYYAVPYLINASPRRVLILGAGAGDDVAQAVKSGAEQVDAVDGRDWLFKLGELNPDKPYASRKVRKVLMDPRSYLRFSKEKYDLIVFGTMEAQTAFSPFGALRPDNLIYTAESFYDASEHLNPAGIMAVSYLPVRGWYAWRLAHNMKLAQLSLDGDVRTGFRNYIIHAGANRQAVRKALSQHLPVAYYRDPDKLAKNCTDAVPTTDDWPFAFVVVGSMPFSYLFCLILLLLTVIFEASTYDRGEPAPDALLERADRGDAPGICKRLGTIALAAAFMLSCDKAMSTLAFYFGSLWQVAAYGAAAFFALAACAAALRLGRLKIHGAIFWILLALSVAADYVFNYEAVVSIPQPLLRLAAGGLLPLLPVFFLAAVLSGRLDRSKSIAFDIGLMFLGFSAGLVLDAISLYKGFASLDLAVLVISACALLLAIEKRRGATTGEEMVQIQT